MTDLPWTLTQYFGVADEIHGGLTLDDLDSTLVAEARAGAVTHGLPWPPDLATVEEYVLDYRARGGRP